MFSKILVANRGEIAVRIIRGAKEMGIATVAVYSDLDREALHVRLADEAYSLGGTTAAESYLNVDAILVAIEKSSTDAVHPGYGFFSENAEFARAITKLGVTFIGPGPDAIDVMGNKISAREAAERVGVTSVPGSTDLVTNETQVLEFAKEHGWPIAIKAAYGGGGRGMKVVAGEAEVESAIESAKRESLAYFGRDEIYMERYLTKPRHVEVQILADNFGNCVYLGTRDCSAQRRHQKLIEEAPASNIAPEVIAAMGKAAVAVAKGCDYVNAGTVEFLYQDGEFHYLEMNTRLQVEHPVTEMVTGVDLVEMQIRIAAGEGIAFSQNDVSMTGHAIEVRINAEDPAEGAFTPSPGVISSLAVPGGFGVRFDSGYESGDEVSQYYDNLIGKLVVWGRTREVAIARMERALGELCVEGVATTIPADLAILGHPDFRALRHSTKWVEDVLDLTGVTQEPAVVPEDSADELVRRSATVEVNGKRFEVVAWVPGTVDGPTPRASRRSRVTVRGSGGTGQIAVPMQGTVVAVKVEVGDTVTEGETLLVLEAMKMENNIAADKAGTVSEIRVSPGDTVGAGDIVAVIE